MILVSTLLTSKARRGEIQVMASTVSGMRLSTCHYSEEVMRRQRDLSLRADRLSLSAQGTRRKALTHDPRWISYSFVVIPVALRVFFLSLVKTVSLNL
jgi:hypothetical protein